MYAFGVVTSSNESNADKTWTVQSWNKKNDTEIFSAN